MPQSRHSWQTGPGWRATTTLDVVLEHLAERGVGGSARKPLVPRTRVRVHLGTEEVLARLAQVRSIAPGESSVARLLLERPIVARGGDRFVLRSFSPVTTIGGGVVLTSAIFAVGHLFTELSPARLAVFFPSLVFGFLRIRSKGIGASVAFHAMCNLFSAYLAHSYFGH